MKGGRVWITWERQRRNSGIAEALEAELQEICVEKKGRLSRYLICVVLTVRYINRRRPKTVCCQSPSIVLVIVLALLKTFYRFVLIADLHNAGIEALYSSPSGLSCFYRWAVKRCNLVLVSNPFLFDEIKSLNPSVLALPDALPRINIPGAKHYQVKQPALVVVSSFAEDEPIADFLNAIADRNSDYFVFVTGRRSRANELLKLESERIIFTDFLPESHYDSLLSQAALVVDLTTRENCLVCGAYESLALNKPFLVSDSSATRWLFGEDSWRTVNAPESYQRQVLSFFDSGTDSDQRLRKIKVHYDSVWDSSLSALRTKLSELEK